MKNLRLPGLFLLCVLAAQALTIATYNVENYLITDRMVEGVFRQSYPKPESEKAALRRVIGAIAPDILAIQEMGKRPFLEELRKDLRAEGLVYPHAEVLEAGDEDRHIAFLSRVPPKNVKRHARVAVSYNGKRDIVKRGVLEATFPTVHGDLTIFVVHLKSRRTEDPSDPEGVAQRGAEAEAVRDLVLSRFPDPTKGLFLICGDFNDTRGSRAVRAITKRGKTEVAEILRASDSRGETWTHFYRREDTYSRIDYLAVSAELKKLIQGGRGHIHDGPGVAEASDHRPVYLKLKD
jgi:endonuclease/exonuclease/phosphatase family metal-dependent hydrolase